MSTNSTGGIGTAASGAEPSNSKSKARKQTAEVASVQQQPPPLPPPPLAPLSQPPPLPKPPMLPTTSDGLRSFLTGCDEFSVYHTALLSTLNSAFERDGIFMTARESEKRKAKAQEQKTEHVSFLLLPT
jgi:hypothetical protein